MRAVKKNNPAATCFIQYDKLFIDNKVYVFNDIQGKVVEYSQVNNCIKFQYLEQKLLFV